MNRAKFASEEQVRYLRDLAHRVEVELPRVIWAWEAHDAITRLEKRLADLRQPMLEGFGREVAAR